MKRFEDYINELGSKLGYLEFIRRHLPEIPIPETIVCDKSGTIDDIIKKIDESIGWPVIIRPSLPEMLNSYDGDFHTDKARDNDRRIFESRFNEVKSVPMRCRKGDWKRLQERLVVGISNDVEPEYTGIMIEHPNLDDVYLITINGACIDECTDRISEGQYLYTPTRGLERYEEFSPKIFSIEDTQDIRESIMKVISWAGEISKLERPDRSIPKLYEFGISPDYLFEVKDLVYHQKHGKEDIEDFIGHDFIIIGDVPQNKRFTLTKKSKDQKNRYPAVRFGNRHNYMTDRNYENISGSIVTKSTAFLSHDAVSIIRRSPWTIFYAKEFEYGKFNDGDTVYFKEPGKIEKLS